MNSDAQEPKRRGPTALFALLLSVLLGAPGPAAAASAAAPADCRQTQASKSTVLVRSLRRSSPEAPDRDDPPAPALGNLPNALTIVPPRRNFAADVIFPVVVRAAAQRAPFHARAPPAA